MKTTAGTKKVETAIKAARDAARAFEAAGDMVNARRLRAHQEWLEDRKRA